MQTLNIYNTLTRKKEIFSPIKPPFVGMYVCGPTVYGPPHLGHARPAITFDVIYRFLKHLGYKVRYVRNITDVGHLEHDGDEGEDKILKKANLEKLEPMEVVQLFLNSYHAAMDKLNVLKPDIEPRASGHIPEQIKMIEKILKNGFGYIKNNSVYFDVLKYCKDKSYGVLSGRNIDELISGEGSRDLTAQEEKINSFDFALWKKAMPEHIMRWDSPWGEGFPGWHLECSVMSTKYLGDTFDIHGGGLDLMFPHHECEIAQSNAANSKSSVKYWLHNNMITINGQKMGKSLGNAINLEQFFNGEHPLLEQPYQPMTIRFFILQAHYRSTLDFGNSALQSAEKGFKKLFNAYNLLSTLQTSDKSTSDISLFKEKCYSVMCDDFNTAELIAQLFEGVRIINSINEKKETITREDLSLLKQTFDNFLFGILGLLPPENKINEYLENAMKIIIELRQKARFNKDYATSDYIRTMLNEYKISVEDTKDGTVWKI